MLDKGEAGKGISTQSERKRGRDWGADRMNYLRLNLHRKSPQRIWDLSSTSPRPFFRLLGFMFPRTPISSISPLFLGNCERLTFCSLSLETKKRNIYRHLFCTLLLHNLGALDVVRDWLECISKAGGITRLQSGESGVVQKEHFYYNRRQATLGLSWANTIGNKNINVRCQFVSP